MTLVQILQKLRDDLLAWGTANFEAVDQNFTDVNSKIETLQGSSSNASTDIFDLKEQVKTNTENIAENISDIDTLETKTANISNDGDNALYIIDKEENVIAYFDAEGLHTTNVEAWELSLKDGISQNGDKFFIIDQVENVIAYIDEDGIHTTNIHANNINVNEGISTKNISISNNISADSLNVNTTIKANIVEVNEGIVQQSGDKFFIIDKKENVVAYIDETGLHTTNIYANLDLDVKDNLNVSGSTNLADIVQVLKSANTLLVKGTSGFDGDIGISGKVTINNGADIKNGLTVSGDASIANSLSVNNKTEIDNSGNITSEGNVDIQGTFKSKYLDATSSDAFYITDVDGNVIARFNENGLYTTEITTKGIKYDEDSKFFVKVNTNEAVDTSVNQTLIDLLNECIDINSRLNNVSNVMDFIGVFDNEVALEAYPTPNKGDVAVVKSTQSEYVYDGNQWVEFGYSTATATAIANLQEVTGHTNGLNIGESNHHTRLENIEAVIGHTNGLNSGESNHHVRLGEHDELLQGLREDLNAEIDDRMNGDTAINYLGDFTNDSEISNPTHGDLAVINGVLCRYNDEAGVKNWESYKGLSKQLYYVNGEASDKFFITDKEDNVVLYVDETGLHTTNLFTKLDLNIDGNVDIKNNLTVKGEIVTPFISTDSLITDKIFDSFQVVSSDKNEEYINISSANGITINNEFSSTHIFPDSIQTDYIYTDTLSVNEISANKINNGVLVVSSNENDTSSTSVYHNGISISKQNLYTNIDAEGIETTTINANTIDSSNLTANYVTVNNEIVAKNMSVGANDSATNLTVRGNTNITNNLIIGNNIISTGTFKSKYLDATASDGFFFIDEAGNTNVYVNNMGLHAKDLYLTNLITGNVSNPISNLIYFDNEDLEIISVDI